MLQSITGKEIAKDKEIVRGSRLKKKLEKALSGKKFVK